jgi:hypothetical protein
MSRPETVKRESPPFTFATYDDAVRHLQRVGVPGPEAMEKARRRYPDLFQKYQDPNAAPPPLQKASKAKADFMMLVDEIAAERNIPTHEAMAVARKEWPMLFSVAYGD